MLFRSFPRADVGHPAKGAILTDTSADVHGSFTVGGTGVYYTAPADRAPDSGFGADYVVSQVCQVPPPPTGTKSVTGGGTIAGKIGGTANFGFTAKAKGGGNVTYKDQGADVAVFKAIQSVVNGSFHGGNAVYGLKDNGVGLGKINPRVPKSEVSALDKIRAQIVSGKITNIPTIVK